MPKLQLIKCDICDKSHEGFKTPQSWFEFYYEYRDLLGGNLRKLEYIVCSFKCYKNQLIKCLNWSQSHCDVKIAEMRREFVVKLLRGIEKDSNTENIFFELPKIIQIKEDLEIKSEQTINIFKQNKIRKSFSRSESSDFFKRFNTAKEAILSFHEKYPESVELDKDIYKRWYYYNNKEK